MFDPQEPRAPFLGGQKTPRASDGIGLMVLYRCSLCQRIWFQDGSKVQLDLEPATIHVLAVALKADLDQLPGATCRVCLARAGSGATEIDEYGRGEGGYGISWEIPGPPVIHALLSLMSSNWLDRQQTMASTLPGPITRPGQMRALLAWFVEQHAPRPNQVTRMGRAWEKMAQQANRPGFGQDGTDGWRWQGGLYRLACPPLHGEAVIQLQAAGPATSPFSFPELFRRCQELVALTLIGTVAGEQRE